MKYHPRNNRHNRRGFTMTEVIIATAILGFVAVGLGQFTLDTSKLLFVSTEKLEINADIRNATNELALNAREANYYFVYDSFVNGAVTGDPVGIGESGDCMVLLFTERRDTSGNPDFTGDNYYTRMMVYFRDTTESGSENRGPVKSFVQEFDLPGEPIDSDVPTLVADYTGPHRLVVELAKGLVDQRLFYRYTQDLIMVKAEIYHGNEYKRVTNTYNFTIAPRG